LDAEAIRDAMLAVSGQLDLKPPKASLIATFGSTVMGPNGPQNIPLLLANATNPNDPNASTRANAMRNMMGQGGFRNPNANVFETPNYKRSVYLPVARNALPRALDAFDFAEPSLLVGEREVSNTAEQALYMLNNPFVVELSDALARKAMKQSKEPRQQMVHAFQLVYGRPPSGDEMKAAPSIPNFRSFRECDFSDLAGPLYRLLVVNIEGFAHFGSPRFEPSLCSPRD
jgi:hypothetical protein